MKELYFYMYIVFCNILPQETKEIEIQPGKVGGKGGQTNPGAMQHNV